MTNPEKQLQLDAANSLMRVAKDRLRAEDVIRILSGQCSNFHRSKSVIAATGKNGASRADGKYVTLRDSMTEEVLASRHCRNHLDAAVLALIWAVHGLSNAE